MFFKTKSNNQRDLLIAYKQVFSTKQGKEVLYDLMNNCHVLSSHKGDAFSEGQRSVVIRILNNCHIDLKAYDELLKGESEQ